MLITIDCILHSKEKEEEEIVPQGWKGDKHVRLGLTLLLKSGQNGQGQEGRTCLWRRCFERIEVEFGWER